MAANSDTTQKNMPLSDVRTPETRSNTPAVIGGEKHSPTPPEILQRAVMSGADPTVLEQLLALEERWQANQARKSYEMAMADLRRDLPEIIKDRVVEYGSGQNKTKYAHEDLPGLIRQIDPVLQQHGFSFRWRTAEVGQGRVSVTCIASHRDGHVEETTLVGPVDNSGGKNAIQAVGSAVTYMQRYTLKAAFGLAAAEDDDGSFEFYATEYLQKIEDARKDKENGEKRLFAIAHDLKAENHIPARVLQKIRNKWSEAMRDMTGVGGAVTQRLVAGQKQAAAEREADGPVISVGEPSEDADAEEGPSEAPETPDSGLYRDQTHAIDELNAMLDDKDLGPDDYDQIREIWTNIVGLSFDEEIAGRVTAKGKPIIATRKAELAKEKAAKK